MGEVYSRRRAARHEGLAQAGLADCLAVTLNALAPTLTQAAAWLQGRPLGIAVGADRPLGWSAVSSAHAQHADHASHCHQAPAGAHHQHGDHCPFCFTHAGSFALAPMSALAWSPAPTRESAAAAPARAPGGREAAPLDAAARAAFDRLIPSNQIARPRNASSRCAVPWFVRSERNHAP